MKIRVFETASQAGLYVATLMEQVILNRESPVLGLATGSTVLPCYKAFIQIANRGLDLSNTVTLNLDEYVGLDSYHEQSYCFFMEENLFSHLSVRPREIHVPFGVSENLSEECKRYDAIIAKYPIDLQLLGIGVNGHIGFNEPDSLLESHTHVVNLTSPTIQSNSRFFRDISQVPQQAITMGVQAILQSKQIVLMAFGEQKADIVARAVKGQVRTDIPASILQLHREVTLVLDEASASLLPN